MNRKNCNTNGTHVIRLRYGAPTVRYEITQRNNGPELSPIILSRGGKYFFAKWNYLWWRRERSIRKPSPLMFLTLSKSLLHWVRKSIRTHRTVSRFCLWKGTVHSNYPSIDWTGDSIRAAIDIHTKWRKIYKEEIHKMSPKVRKIWPNDNRSTPSKSKDKQKLRPAA